MADAVLVVLLLVLIWAAVLVPPAAGARASREADFLGSIRPGHDPVEGTLGRSHADFDDVDESRFRPALTANARRRQVLGGLVVAMGATLVLGLMPTFHLLLVVHLFLVNSCLAYVGLLVHMRDQAAGTRVRAATVGYYDDYASDLADDLEATSTYARESDSQAHEAYGADDDEADGYAYAGSDYDGYGYSSGYDSSGYDISGYDDEAEAAFVDELDLARPA